MQMAKSAHGCIARLVLPDVYTGVLHLQDSSWHKRRAECHDARTQVWLQDYLCKWPNTDGGVPYSGLPEWFLHQCCIFRAATGKNVAAGLPVQLANNAIGCVARS